MLGTIETNDSFFDSNKALKFSGLLITALIGGVATYSMMETPAFVAVAVLAVAQLVLFIVFSRIEKRKTLVTLFWLEAICIAALIYLVPSSFIVILTVVWLVQSVELFGIRRTIPYSLASLVYFVAAQFAYFGLDDWLNILISFFIYGLLQLFAVSVVQRAINERGQRQQMAALNRELIATRELLSQSSAQSERLRIARDLHDILGHHMTALILNLEVASHSVDGEPKEKVEQSLALAKLLLTDLRNTVSELRDDSALDLEKSIRQLIAGIPDFAFDVDFSDAPDVVDVDTAETLLRCTQEAVTNVLRHSNADRCCITMKGEDDRLTLSVIDNGSGEKAAAPGNGLTGMSERVRACGGELAWQQDDQGFQLHVTLGTTSAS